LPIAAALNDTDGSETLSISIKNLPSEITLNNGIKQADGSYLLSQNDLSNLQLIIGSFSGHLNIEIEATSIELSNSDTVYSHNSAHYLRHQGLYEQCYRCLYFQCQQNLLNCRLIDNQLNLIYLAYHPQIN
jgi:hypothetical protein